jgi:hypothetical protein
MTQAISAQPGRTSGTVLTAIDVVRLSLVQLKGGSPQASLPNGLARAAQNLTPLVSAGQGPVGQTPPVQQVAVQAAIPATTHVGVQNNGAPTGEGSLARNLAAETIRGDAVPRTLPAHNRPAVGGVFVEGRSPQASAILQSHGMIAGLLRTDVILQVTDRSYKNIDGRLSRMQDLARRAASGDISAETRARLDAPFQQLKQEVAQLASVAQPGAEAIVTYVAADRASAMPVSPITGIKGEVQAVRLSLAALPVATLVDVMLPNVVAGVAVADIFEPSVAGVAGPVIEKAREGISQVQRIIVDQRTEIGSRISQELSRIISLSVQRTDPVRAVPALQLSSTVAAKLLSPTTVIPKYPGPAVSDMDRRGVNNVPPAGAAGASSDHARVVSLDMVSGQPNRTGLIALLSPDPRALEDPGSPALRNMVQIGDRPMPVPASALSTDLLFGLVPGGANRIRGRSDRPKKTPPTKPGQRPRKGREGDGADR